MTQPKYVAGDKVRTRDDKPSHVVNVIDGEGDEPLYVVLHDDGSGGGIERESNLTPEPPATPLAPDGSV